MTTFPNLNSVLKELDEISENGVDFSGRAINWGSAADGATSINYNYYHAIILVN